MTVRLLPVTRDHVRPLIRLEVAEDQRDFVAPNAVSLAQAPYETGAYPFGIWAGETPVGFLSLIDTREHDYLEPDEAPDFVYLWRLMIATDQQAKGYGRAAMLRVVDWTKGRGLPFLMTSAVESNAVALRFYEGLGFTRTGRIIDGEVELRRAV